MTAGSFIVPTVGENNPRLRFARLFFNFKLAYPFSPLFDVSAFLFFVGVHTIAHALTYGYTYTIGKPFC